MDNKIKKQIIRNFVTHQFKCFLLYCIDVAIRVIVVRTGLASEFSVLKCKWKLQIIIKWHNILIYVLADSRNLIDETRYRSPFIK